MPKGIQGFQKGHIGLRKGPPWNKNLKGIKTSNKGMKPWNIGLTKETDERVLKYSINGSKTQKGRHYSPNTEFKKNDDRTKKIRAKQITPKQDTSIEIKIQNFLKQLKIEFFTHQYMKIKHGYQCDILIPSLNIIIECDGDYWHNYPIGNDLDHIRTKELIEKGFKILRLWEHEIKEMNLNCFKERLL